MSQPKLTGSSMNLVEDAAGNAATATRRCGRVGVAGARGGRFDADLRQVADAVLTARTVGVDLGCDRAVDRRADHLGTETQSDSTEPFLSGDVRHQNDGRAAVPGQGVAVGIGRERHHGARFHAHGSGRVTGVDVGHPSDPVPLQRVSGPTVSVLDGTPGQILGLPFLRDESVLRRNVVQVRSAIFGRSTDEVGVVHRLHDVGVGAGGAGRDGKQRRNDPQLPQTRKRVGDAVHGLLLQGLLGAYSQMR